MWSYYNPFAAILANVQIRSSQEHRDRRTKRNRIAAWMRQRRRRGRLGCTPARLGIFAHNLTLGLARTDSPRKATERQARRARAKRLEREAAAMRRHGAKACRRNSERRVHNAVKRAIKRGANKAKAIMREAQEA